MLTKEKIIEAISGVKDPEVGFDVWTMGLIYKLEIAKNDVKILMTYTTPFCPWGPELNEQITAAVKSAGADKVDIEITFDPPYKIPPHLRALIGI